MKKYLAQRHKKTAYQPFQKRNEIDVCSVALTTHNFCVVALLTLFVLTLAACQPASSGAIISSPGATESASNANSAGAQGAQPRTGSAQNAPAKATIATNAPYDAPAPDAGSVDLTRLPLGDNLKSTSPKIGYLWNCMSNPNAGGAQRNGPWIKSDGTYDYTAKAVVDGSVKWQSNIQVTVQGNSRIITTNDLPNHATGTYPIASSDDAYQYDRNPNRIQSQNFRVELPANPTLASSPSCTPGAIGMLLSGSSLFNALDAPGRDAVAHETQDSCSGHPQESGAYHYHNLTNCIADKQSADGHSSLMGYIIDGFGIYGHRGVGGKTLSSKDLDECHGHTHTIDWDSKQVSMYHYHATYDFPYTAGCIRGTFNQSIVRAISGTGGGNQNGAPPQQGQGGNPQGQNGQPPQFGNNQQGQFGQPPQFGNNQQGQNGQPPQFGNNQQPNGQRPDLATAAAKLGITEQQLRDALGPPPPNLASAAQKLGITEAQLKAALGVP